MQNFHTFSGMPNFGIPYVLIPVPINQLPFTGFPVPQSIEQPVAQGKFPGTLTDLKSCCRSQAAIRDYGKPNERSAVPS